MDWLLRSTFLSRPWVWPSRTLALWGAFAAAFQPAIAYANPQGGVVSGGQATISSSGSTLNVNQSSNQAIIDWSSFNVGAGETTAFHQPSSSSIALNRVHDSNPSQIFGTLTANGQIILVNPNGVFFAPGSKVDVSGLIASTADIRNNDFMAGNYQFSLPGNPNAAIVNQGTITAAQAGLVGLVGPQVENDGIITARLGKITLASGDTYTLDLAGDSLIQVQVSDLVKQQIVNNTGVIEVDGGSITLTAAAGGAAVNSLISNSGVVQANAVAQQGGTIVFYAEGSNAVPGNDPSLKGQKAGSSTVLNSGIISASGYGPGQTGGSISLLADNVGILSGSAVDASGDAGGGTIRIGGDFHGAGSTPTASATLVQTGSSIFANALSSGDGGAVAVWSDNYTNFAGTIQARGGTNGGNGGFIETSGKKLLSASGLVDASAPLGQSGTWLLDPADVTISGADSGMTGNPSFVPDGSQAEATINAADINTALNAGTSVSVTTGGDAASGTGGGSITVASNIAKTAGGDATLTLSAATDIIVNSNVSISSTSGKLNTLLDSDTAGNGGAIVLNLGSSITSNGGNITLGGGSGAITAGVLNADGTLNTAAAGFAVADGSFAYGIFVNAAPVNAGGGTIVMNGEGYNSAAGLSYGVNIAGSTVQTSGTGAIAISGTGQGITNSGSDYGVRVAGAGKVLTTGSRNVTVIGVGGGAGSGTANYGVDASGANSTIETTGSGNVLVNGTGGNAAGSGGNNYGVYSLANGGIQATGTGNIVVVGQGGNNSGSGNTNYGVYAATTNAITNSGTGSITVTGTGGNGTGSSNMGVRTLGISGSNGNNITVTGTGGNAAGSGGSDIGIQIQNGISSLATSGAGNITVHGYGGGNSGANGTDYGIDIAATANVGTTGNGNVQLIGVGGDAGGSGNNNFGIHNFDITFGIHSTGGGNVSLTGTGGNSSGTGNYGIYADGIVITSGGAGSITLTGTGKNSAYDIYGDVAPGSPLIGGASTTGNITFNANTLSFASSIQTTGSVTFAPNTASTSIGVAGGAGTLQITGVGGILANTTAGSITIGAASDTATLTANAYTWAEPVTLLNGSGNIAINGAEAMGSNTFLADTASGNLTLGSSGSVTSSAAGTAITLAASGGNFTNNSGSGALSASSGSWLVYSTNPANDTDNGLSNSFRRFSCSYGGSCPSFPATGNGFLYSYTPTLTATPTGGVTLTYGDAVPSLTGYAYNLSGYLGSDSGSDSVSGSLNGSTNYTQGSSVGSYAINYSSGSLASSLGYGFSYANNSTGITVGQKNLTITASNLPSIVQAVIGPRAISQLSESGISANPQFATLTPGWPGLVQTDPALLPSLESNIVAPPWWLPEVGQGGETSNP